MEKLIIHGGGTLSGHLVLSASKNAFLPILAGSILTDKEVVLHRCPYYSDIFNMCEILEGIGVRIKREDSVLTIDPSNIKEGEVMSCLAKKLRSSIFMLGPLLGRLKKAKVAYPGGCEIGSRPIDLHIKGLEALNVKVTDKHGYLFCDGSNMKGGKVYLDFPSVGATENIMMAAVLTKGQTVIYNAAKEPEVEDLQNFLNSLGAKIYGAGSDIIKIEGVKELHETSYFPISDRIITGTYIIACAMVGGKIEIEGVNPFHISSLIDKLDKTSCKVTTVGDKIKITSEGRHKNFKKIETMPYPGFPTDLQPQIMALAAVSAGTSIIVENLFDARFKHVPELVKMGADIVVKDRTAIIHGKDLYGAEVSCADLRGGAALVLAGLSGSGYTTISNLQHIDRGYDRIEKDLAMLGADIIRTFS